MVMSSRPLAPHRARCAPASASGAGPALTRANVHDAANTNGCRGKSDEADSSSSPPQQWQSPPPCKRRWRRGLGRVTLIATVAGAVFAIAQVAIAVSSRRGGRGGFGVVEDGDGMLAIPSPFSSATEGDDQSREDAAGPLRSDADMSIEGGDVSATAEENDGVRGAAEDLGRLLSSPDGAVRGNPMANPACRDALLLAHGLNATDLARDFHSEYAVGGRRDGEPRPKNLPPSFYSREALSAMLAEGGGGRHELELRGIVRANWNVRGGGVNARRRRRGDNFTRAAYIHLVKCASSSVASMLQQSASRPFHQFPYVNDPTTDRDHLAFHGDCTFTFVRDPLHRLVSAYYTIHHMMSSQVGQGGPTIDNQLDAVRRRWAFWNVTSEPDRFRTFVREFTTSGRSHEFVRLHPLQHVYTMSGQMSPWYGTDVHFIGRVEKFEEHWDLLSRGEGPCRGSVPEIATGDGAMPHAMDARGAFRVLPPDLVEALGLDEPEAWAAARGRGSKLELPPYKEMVRNQSLFNEIVEHYWQDYVCFGYDLNYTHLGTHYTGQFRKPY